MKHRIILYLAPVILGCVTAVAVLAMVGTSPGMTFSVKDDASRFVNNGALQELYRQFMADRMPISTDRKVDASNLRKHDLERVVEVRRLYEGGKIVTGEDSYEAAVLLQHGSSPEDFLLAHDLAVLALARGVDRALWLAGATEDRFLISIGRPQRFKTQYEVPLGSHAEKPYPEDPNATQKLRNEMNANTLISPLMLRRGQLVNRPSL